VNFYTDYLDETSTSELYRAQI